MPISLFTALILFQLLPLPSRVLKHLSHNTYNRYKTALPHYDTIRAGNLSLEIGKLSLNIGHPDDFRSISIHRRATKKELLKILAYIGIFFLIVNNIRRKNQTRRLVLAIIITGLVVALIGILQMASGTDKIYWFWQSKYKIRGYFGPYVNPNHFAGYMEMIIPIALGLLISYFQRSYFPGGNWRSRLSALEPLFSRGILLVFAIIIMSSSLLLSASRTGILSFFCSLILLAVLMIIRRPTKRHAWIIIIIAGLVIFFAHWIGLNYTIERFSELFSRDIFSYYRFSVWENSCRLIADYPLFGTGLGTFRYIFPKYKSPHIHLFYDHAHNDYIELLSDTGFIGFLAITVGLVFFLIRTISKWLKRKDPYVVGITIGGITGIFSLLLHSITDFNTHIPANALLLAIIIGLIYSIMSSHR